MSTRTVKVEFNGREHTYEVGDCACGRTSVRYYAEGRCYWCSTPGTWSDRPTPGAPTI